MTDNLLYERRDFVLEELPGSLRMAAVLGECPSVTLTMSPKDWLALARVIERGLEPQLVLVAPPRPSIWTSEPMRMAGVILCLCAMVLA